MIKVLDPGLKFPENIRFLLSAANSVVCTLVATQMNPKFDHETPTNSLRVKHSVSVFP